MPGEAPGATAIMPGTAWLHHTVTTPLALDHIVLVVGDVERSLAWYERHVGLVPMRVDEWRTGAVPFPSLRVTEETIIDLIPGEPRNRGHLDHICFVVEVADLEELRAAGELIVEEEGQRFGARGVASSIYVRDPDGLLVELRAYPSTGS
jgi:catechol 2,3-dioxygenase-like lactoylglutathione lyase family enzyme